MAGPLTGHLLHLLPSLLLVLGRLMCLAAAGCLPDRAAADTCSEKESEQGACSDEVPAAQFEKRHFHSSFNRPWEGKHAVNTCC